VSKQSYYIVDRSREVHAGLVIDRVPVPDMPTADETALARCVFPEGVTRWGENKFLFTQPSVAVTVEMLAAWKWAVLTPAGYLVNPTGAEALRDGKDRLLEMIVELVRRLEFPERPSRYTSVFAYATVAAAADFRGRCGQPDDPVWRVGAGGATHEADARHVNLEPMPLAVVGRALRYWRGEFDPDPEPWQQECLLTPPVEVIERVAT
jgi:hypothetical protein